MTQRRCTICNSPNREAVEKAILAGGSLRTVAQQHHVSKDALHRHKAHISLVLKKSAEIRDVARGGDLWEELESLKRQAQRYAKKAEKAGDLRTCVAAVRELSRIEEIRAKAEGQIRDQQTTVNVAVGVAALPEWLPRLLRVLERHPLALAEVRGVFGASGEVRALPAPDGEKR